MRRFTKGIDLVIAQQKRFDALKVTREEGHRDLALQGLQDSRELTAGNLTPKQTRGAFARGANPSQSMPTARRRALSPRQKKNRGLAGSVPLLPVNIQKGDLNRAMKMRQAAGRGVQSFDVGPDSSAGRSAFVLTVGGTRFMVARTYWAEVKRRWKARNAAFIQHYIRKQRI